MTSEEADLERRFGGLRRLYGDTAYERVRAARVVVVGLGGVGSWAVEALARSGVAELVLIDLDHVSESNVNRQVQALESTLGQSKAEALKERIDQIHPGCRVTCIEEFVDEDNWPGLLGSLVRDGWPGAAGKGLVGGDREGAAPTLRARAASGSAPVVTEFDVVIDCCDQVRAKGVLAAWSLATGTPLVMVGAAGGKRRPQAVEADDLSLVTHDPLLASLRQRLRKFHGGARTGNMGLRCVFSREPVVQPEAAACEIAEVGDVVTGTNDGTLNCHGYGSTVTVTATFGMVAANEAVEAVIRGPRQLANVRQAPHRINSSSVSWPSPLSVI